MSDIVCITNRKLVKGDFFLQIEKIAKGKPRAIILREKDLSEEEYFFFAERLFEICERNEVPLVIHSFYKVAVKLGCKNIHMPLSLLKEMTQSDKSFFDNIGASCHSLSDAIISEKLGCTYITAGHIFETDCKKGLPGRGLDFLKDVCDGTSLPVYAIGGISKNNYSMIKKTGAKGACIMSTLMLTDDPKKLLEDFENEI